MRLLTKTLENAIEIRLLDIEECYDTFIANQSLSFQYGSEIAGCKFLDFIDWWHEEDSFDWVWDGADDKTLRKYFEYKFESCYIYVDIDFCHHGWLFDDGTMLSSNGADHRSINPNKWYPYNIITIYVSDNALEMNIRVNNKKTNGYQKRALEDLFKQFKNLQKIHYDIYEQDYVKSSGVFDSYDFGQKIWRF